MLCITGSDKLTIQDAKQNFKMTWTCDVGYQHMQPSANTPQQVLCDTSNTRCKGECQNLPGRVITCRWLSTCTPLPNTLRRVLCDTSDQGPNDQMRLVSQL